MKTAVEQFWQDVQEILPSSVDTETGIKLLRAFEQAKEIEKEQRGYSEEDLFQILLDFVAFPHHDMEQRGSIIERYLNELSKKKLNN
jgi:hypothetical protein